MNHPMNTELSSRPRARGRAGEAEPRPLALSALLATLAAAGTALVVCMAVAVIGWFLADAGGHGTTNDALRIGADAWLMGLGSHLVVAGTTVGMVPLTLTALIALAGFRCGRWAGRTSRPPEDHRALAAAAAIAAASYVVIVIVVALLAQRPAAQPVLSLAVLGALVVGGGSVGLGLAVGTGRSVPLLGMLPGYLLAAARGALAALALLFALSSLLVAVALLGSFNEASQLFSGLHLGAGDALMLCVVTALFAPNAAGLATCWLVGPGFAFGAGTSVTVSATSLGPLPAFPLLAALPEPGSSPGWLVVLVGVPPLCAAIGAGLAQHRYAVTAWDSAALRGFATGLAGALLVWLLVAFSGGALGSGRMADVGAPLGEVLVTAVGGMSIGGLLGGLAVALWQRRRARG